MPALCPSCGQPLPHPPAKRGRPAAIVHGLAALYADGQPFAVDDAARALGVSAGALRSALARLKRQGRAERLDDAVISSSGQSVGLWRLV